MYTFKALVSRSLLALVLAAASSLALAGPTYHVAIDTSTLGSGAAYLDLGLSDFGDSGPVTATLSGFQGNFGSTSFVDGDSQGSVAPGDTLVLRTSGEVVNDLVQEIALGGLFSFDVSFDTGNIGNVSSFFASLYSSDFSANLGMDGNLVQIDLMPGASDVLSPNNSFGTISADSANVPEPSTMLSMMTGLSLLGFALRRSAR